MHRPHAAGATEEGLNTGPQYSQEKPMSREARFQTTIFTFNGQWAIVKLSEILILIQILPLKRERVSICLLPSLCYHRAICYLLFQSPCKKALVLNSGLSLVLPLVSFSHISGQIKYTCKMSVRLQ